MDKVDFTGAALLNASLHPNQKPGTNKTKSKSEASGAKKTLFSQMLEDSAQADLGPLLELAPSQEAQIALMDAVHSAGSDLKERPFAEEILQFKKAVRNFIHYVVENGYEVQKISGTKKKIVSHSGTKWGSVVYHQIQVVDQKLEELAAAIMSGQAAQLERVSKIDEITGLLVDLTVSGVIKERDE